MPALIQITKVSGHHLDTKATLVQLLSYAHLKTCSKREKAQKIKFQTTAKYSN